MRQAFRSQLAQTAVRAFCWPCCRNAAPLDRYIPQQRHVLVASRRLDDVAAGREREVIAGDQRPVGCNTVEKLLARRNRERSVDVELRLPLGVTREQRRMLRGVA